MKISLITPNDTSVVSNLGCDFITAGIKYVLNCTVQGDNNYYNLPAHTPAKESWNVLDASDLLVFCGNPRFNTSEVSTYTDVGIWDEILYARIPIIDAWNGSANSISDMNNETRIYNIVKVHKTKKLINYAKLCKLFIARDIVLYNILKEHHDNLRFLPCSTWWAKDYYRILPRNKIYNTIVIRRLERDEWIIKTLVDLSKTLSPCRIIVVCIDDWIWVKKHYPVTNVELINDPIELLQLLAETDKLVSLRVHSTIPAMSVGAQVCNIYMDSRFLTCDPFGIKSVSFWDLKNAKWEPKFSYPTNTPKLEDAILAFKSVIV